MNRSSIGILSQKEILELPSERIEVSKLLTDEQTKELEGHHLKRSQIPTIIDRNCDVYDKDSGDCLLKFRKGVVPSKVVVPAYDALHKAGEMPSDNRGMAGGPVSDAEIEKVVQREGGKGFVRSGPYRYRIIKADGTVSNTTRSIRTNGSIVGYFGASPRQPYCRLTSYTEKNFSKFVKAYPAVWWMDSFYEALMNEQWKYQKKSQERASPDFTIKDSAFSTITVNKNFPTACHYDAGDLRGAFGNLMVIRRGKYEGGETCFPQYGIGVDVHSKDILLMDVHRLHGNLPIVPKEPGAVRLALVMYFREDVQKCEDADKELEKARKLWEERVVNR